MVQSVLTSFIQGDFEIHDWNSLWGLLVRMTLYKCGKKVEFYQAAKRSIQREVRPKLSDDDSCNSWATLSREPSPEDVAALHETIEQVMQPLNERERHVFQLSLQGMSVHEIGDEVGRSARQVRRIRDQIQKRLVELNEAI